MRKGSPTTLLRLGWLALIACGGPPWSVAGAPDAPPDRQFRTGTEAGEDVYVWECHKGQRVVVHQSGSACLGTRPPVITRGPCGEPLPVESKFPPLDGGGVSRVPESLEWPGTPRPRDGAAD
ncbi:MAG: hypothetical protein IPQ09_17830 [Myxococcales bacterium]|nr:hypothetical protein [Myxococcales bacterium]HQY64400.1 hypothetical protein [Polyangiaceae bacterium]